MLALTLAYHHCQLPEQSGVTLLISDSAMTDLPNTDYDKLWSNVTPHQYVNHSLTYIGKSSDRPQKPREEIMTLILDTIKYGPNPENFLSLILTH